MKFSNSLIVAGAAAKAVLAKHCQDLEIPVTITTENYVFGLPEFADNLDVADFVDVFTSRTPPSTDYFSGTVNETANYTIGATFCTPDQGGNTTHKSTVLIATHGLAYDRSYWHPEINESTYSFVDFAVDQGYSILYYDRLGVGKSTKLSGYKAQLSQQIAILQELTSLVKTGKYTGSNCAPSKVVLIGHSYGSSITLGATSLDSSIADAIVLTGFGLNATYSNGGGFLEAAQPRIASLQNPDKWQQLDSGYLTPVDIYATANTFFKKGDYDVEALQYSESTKTPFAISEFLTINSVPGLPYDYTGATLVLSGKYDFIICTSDCDGALEHPAAEVFSNAKSFQAISYPLAGHGINLHLNARGSYEQITDFLSANGL